MNNVTTQQVLEMAQEFGFSFSEAFAAEWAEHVNYCAAKCGLCAEDVLAEALEQERSDCEASDREATDFESWSY